MAPGDLANQVRETHGKAACGDEKPDKRGHPDQREAHAEGDDDDRPFARQLRRPFAG